MISNRAPAFYMFLFLIFLIGFIVLFELSKLEHLPTFIVSVMAMTFSYHALTYTREKFRVDLFEKRFEVYLAIVDFCSAIHSNGGLGKTPENKELLEKAHQDAYKSFRGIGYHKSRLLFGSDIKGLLDELNIVYSFMSSVGNNVANPAQAGKLIQYTENSWKILNELPKSFASYLYFGDYKNFG